MIRKRSGLGSGSDLELCKMVHSQHVVNFSLSKSTTRHQNKINAETKKLLSRRLDVYKRGMTNYHIEPNRAILHHIKCPH